jgi:hypothetical protein
MEDLPLRRQLALHGMDGGKPYCRTGVVEWGDTVKERASLQSETGISSLRSE